MAASLAGRHSGYTGPAAAHCHPLQNSCPQAHRRSFNHDRHTSSERPRKWKQGQTASALPLQWGERPLA